MAASKSKNPKILIDAAIEGDVHRVQSLIDYEFGVNGRGRYGVSNSTALHAASGEGHADVAEVLIKHGADVNAKNEDGWTPLHYVARNGSEAITRLLLQSKADIDAQKNNGSTPLHIAMLNGHKAITRLLLKSKAVIDAQNNLGNTPLHDAAQTGKEKPTKLLLEYKASVDIQNKNGKTPLHLAVASIRDVTTRLLLKSQASTDVQDCRGDTPLHMAVRNGCVKTTKLLLEYKASVAIQNKDGHTPLAKDGEMYGELFRHMFSLDNLEDSEYLRFIILPLSLAPSDISIKDIIKKSGKLAKFFVDSPDVAPASVDICDDEAASTLASWEKKGYTMSVVIFSDNEALSMLDKVLEKHVISSVFLFEIDMNNIKKIKVSHALHLISIKSFDPEKVMSWLLPSTKVLQCVDNTVGVPWSIKLPCSLDILNICHSTLRVQKHFSASKVTKTKYIHLACDGLKQLYLNDNGLTALQEDIGSFPGLKVLNVSNNSIQRMPPSLCKLADIQTLNIEGNPSVNIPPDILGKGRKAVCNYLKEFLDSNKVPKNNVKVVLLGHEGVGKTTLVKAITGGNAKNVEKTDGITVSIVRLDHSNINLTFFDFAGDVDFLESHSLFITDDSVFLVVFDLSKFAIGNSINEVSSLHQLGRVRLWLQTIFTYAPNSSVILIGTHADAKMLNKDVLDLIWLRFQEIFSVMRDSHHLSYKKNTRRDCLVCQVTGASDRKSRYGGIACFVSVEGSDEAIVSPEDNSSEKNIISSFPHVVGYFEVCSIGKFPKGFFLWGNNSIKQVKRELAKVCERVIKDDPVIPEKWHLLRESLKSKRMKSKNPIMSYSEYQELARVIGIAQERALDNVTSFLCSQGEIVVNLSKSGDDSGGSIVVLDPQWLANKLRTLITYERDGQSQEEYIDARGILSNEKMKMWIDEDKDHRSLLEVFEAMHVCVPFSEASKTAPGGSSQPYLFPCKLPVGQPSYDDWFPYPKSGEKQASLLFQFGFLPPLFFCDLIVTLHNMAMSKTDKQPKYTRNNIVFLCDELVELCEFCQTAKHEGRTNNVPHLVRFEMLFHSNSILASAKGPSACCVVRHLGKVLSRVKMKPLYRYVVMKSATSLACPHCISRRQFEIGEMTIGGNSYMCSIAYDHNFDSMEKLLSWHGVDRIDLTKLMKDIHDDRQCPSYFVMLPLNTGSMSVLDQITHWVQSHFYDGYAVHLLCEWPNQLHFINSPGYRIRNVKGFIKKYGKHVIRVLNIVQKVGCLLSFALGPQSASPASTVANVAKEANAFLLKVVNDFCEQYPDLGKILKETKEESTRGLEKSKEGLKRREFQRFLCKNDEDGQFGGLYPINHGDRIIWVCEEHGKIYETR